MKPQPPVAEGQSLFEDVRAPLDQEETSAGHPGRHAGLDPETRIARNVAIWTLSGFVAFWMMVFTAYILAR